MGQYGDLVTFEAGLVVTGPAVSLGVGPAGGERGNAADTAGDHHCQQEETSRLFHGGDPSGRKYTVLFSRAASKLNRETLVIQAANWTILVMFKLIRRILPNPARWAVVLAAVLLTACLAGHETTEPQLVGTGTIVVEMEGFHNDRGLAWVLLFAGPEGFPDDPAKALRDTKAEIREGRSEITFHDVPLGFYAISVLHDENDDDRMGTSLFGFPEEGFGVSNGAGQGFGPPEFKDARIILLIDRLIVPVRVKYLESIRNERRRERRGE
jgi:uncharacterized protein (DUF2141 family)